MPPSLSRREPWIRGAMAPTVKARSSRSNASSKSPAPADSAKKPRRPDASPSPAPPVRTQTKSRTSTEVDNIDEDGLILVGACCCSNTGLYTVFPECIGFSGEGELLCCTTKACLRLGAPSYGLGCGTSGRECGVCHCLCVACGLVSPNTCCKFQKQCCCCVTNSALPPTDEVPCMCTLFPFCVVFPKCGFCKTIGDVRPLSKFDIEKALKAKAAPAQSMDR